MRRERNRHTGAGVVQTRWCTDGKLHEGHFRTIRVGGAVVQKIRELNGEDGDLVRWGGGAWGWWRRRRTVAAAAQGGGCDGARWLRRRLGKVAPGSGNGTVRRRRTPPQQPTATCAALSLVARRGAGRVGGSRGMVENPDP